MRNPAGCFWSVVGFWVIVLALGWGIAKADPLDKWRAYADIGEPNIEVFFQEPCPGTAACSNVFIDAQGNINLCQVISGTDDFWVLVHEYGHCLGLALGGHTTGVMSSPLEPFTLGNVAQIRELYPRYEYRLTVADVGATP